MDRRRKYDWTKIQTGLNEGLTWKELRAKYGCTFGAIADAKHRGEIETRTTSELGMFRSQQSIKNDEWVDLGMEDRKRLVFVDQNGQCYECKLNQWRDKPLTLELEHKDGNRHNNLRDNLIYLCPNCHSQTLTWRGRNKAVKKFSDQEIIIAIQNHVNIHQVLLSLGLAPKGGNYKRIRKFWYLKNLVARSEVESEFEGS